MQDNKIRTGNNEHAFIKLDNENEVQKWSNKLGITIDKLKRAVIDVGNDVRKIELHILKNSSN